jgi:hypothetical protein
VKGVQDVLRAEGGDSADLADTQLLFPTEETQAQLRSFASLDPDTEEQCDARFAEITGA